MSTLLTELRTAVSKLQDPDHIDHLYRYVSENSMSRAGGYGERSRSMGEWYEMDGKINIICCYCGAYCRGKSAKRQVVKCACGVEHVAVLNKYEMVRPAWYVRLGSLFFGWGR